MTTQTEALKLALEGAANYIDTLGGDSRKYRQVLAQPEQEPAALRTMRMWITALKSVSDNGQHMNIPSGLSSGTCWELAVELERFINTTPQQRTWVGLTEVEINEVLGGDIRDEPSGLLEFVQAIEAKLKEKNT